MTLSTRTRSCTATVTTSPGARRPLDRMILTRLIRTAPCSIRDWARLRDLTTRANQSHLSMRWPRSVMSLLGLRELLAKRSEHREGSIGDARLLAGGSLIALRPFVGSILATPLAVLTSPRLALVTLGPGGPGSFGLGHHGGGGQRVGSGGDCRRVLRGAPRRT